MTGRRRLTAASVKLIGKVTVPAPQTTPTQIYLAVLTATPTTYFPPAQFGTLNFIFPVGGNTPSAPPPPPRPPPPPILWWAFITDTQKKNPRPVRLRYRHRHSLDMHKAGANPQGVRHRLVRVRPELSEVFAVQDGTGNAVGAFNVGAGGKYKTNKLLY